MESDGSVHIDYSKYEHWKYDKFARFVNDMLLRRDTYLHTFKLHFKRNHLINFKDVRTWIGYAVKHKVKVLDVDQGQYDKTLLPCCIFTCRSLQELNLSMGEAPEDDLEHEGLLPDMIKLPSLKRLTLRDVEVSSLDLKQIFAQSPGLEDMDLVHCARHLELVQSNVLKRLTIDGFFDRGEGLTTAASHLIHFKCIGWPLEEITWQKRPSLESAHIDTWCSERTFDGQSDLIGIVLHAKRIALCGSDIKAMLEKELHSCPVFDNLVTLEIGGWCLTNDMYVVVRFLQLSPGLEKLTLKQRSCPLLETVIIQCSKDDNEIEKMVNAMVGYGISLEKIQVIFYEDIERAKRWGMSLEQMKEHYILEKARMENRKRDRVDDSNAGSGDNYYEADEDDLDEDEDDEDDLEDDDDNDDF